MFQRRLFYVMILMLVLTKPYAQINLQTGSAVFSLPVFNWQDDKSRLNTAVALNYSSGNGLKVNDPASNVGQGWNCIAGGVISRIQVGEPDDQQAYGNASEADIKKYPNGYLYATKPAEDGCPSALTTYPIYGYKNQVYTQHNSVAEDKQLDYFSFQFNGKAGMFVLDKISGDHGIMLGDSKIKITFQRTPGMATGNTQGTRTTISSFTIQDVDGLIYRFSELGKTKVLELNYCNDKLEQKLTQPKFKEHKVYHQASFDNGQYINPYVIGSWYLKEVEDPFTHRKIIYHYDTRLINSIAGEDISYNVEGEYALITHKTSISQTPILTSIDFPDQHAVVFNYNSADRLDLKGEKALASIDVKYTDGNNVLRNLSRHLLKTSYFILNRYGTPITDYEKSVARLCLLSVTKIGIDLLEDSPPYQFDYFMGGSAADDVVPPPFTYARDIWGFYNGTNTKGYNNEAIDITTPASWASAQQLEGVCYRRNGNDNVQLNPKSGYAKNGLLRQIIYPTGGTLSYEYKQNEGKINGTGNDVLVGGVHVFKTISTAGGGSTACDNKLTTQYNYLLSDNSTSSLWGIELPDNDVASSSHYEPEYRVYRYPISALPFGRCEFKYQYPGILSTKQAVGISDLQQVLAAISPVLSIVSTVSMVIDIIQLVSLGTGPLAVIIDIVTSLVEVALTCFNNPSKTEITNTLFNSDQNSVSPLPAQFKRVEVIEMPAGIGRTVYDFTSSDDYAVWKQTNPNFTSQQRFAPWAYGLPKTTTVYDQSNKKVKETYNVYDFTFAKSIINYCWAGHPGLPCNASNLSTNLVSCKCLVTATSSQRNIYWTDPNRYNDPTSYKLASYSDGSTHTAMNVEFYATYTGRVQLASSSERNYTQGDDTKYVETVTNYSYNTTDNYEPYLISTSSSNGDYLSKEIKYTSNFSGGAITTMLNNNVVSLPVSTITRISKPSGTYGMLQEMVTEFTQITNGDIKPARTLEQRFSEPQPAAAGYGGPGGSIAAYKIIQVFTYDAQGNMIGLKDEGNRQIANIYDYKDKYVTASVINADAVADNVAYSSFENDGSYGGWALSGGSPAYDLSNNIMGKRSFNLAARTFSRSLNTAKGYILSFWAKNGTVSVTGGATLSKSDPVIDGFTYYEYNIAQGTASVSVSGSALIDELRLYPNTSRMRTVTYDPLIGKTAEADENNRITYYEYDNLGRMRFIKDEKRNIVKMFEYNNVSASKQNGCPGIYYNRYIEEKFVKSDCGAGYRGDIGIYFIPANTYSSTISQEDADAQAQHQLLSLGQSSVNTTLGSGGCKLIYYNSVQDTTVATESCAEGFVGGAVTYTVPANRYSSIISAADANEQARDEIRANAQAYANNPANAVCVSSNVPLWEWDGTTSNCQIVECEKHLFVFEKDVNPNSSTYNQTRWYDVGPSDACPVPTPTIYASLTYENAYSVYNSNWGGYDEFRDIKVSFYNSNGPVNVTNQNIILNQIRYHNNTTVTTAVTWTVSGTSSVLLTNMLLNGDIGLGYEDNIWYLTACPALGYNIQ